MQKICQFLERRKSEGRSRKRSEQIALEANHPRRRYKDTITFLSIYYCLAIAHCQFCDKTCVINHDGLRMPRLLAPSKLVLSVCKHSFRLSPPIVNYYWRLYGLCAHVAQYTCKCTNLRATILLSCYSLFYQYKEILILSFFHQTNRFS